MKKIAAIILAAAMTGMLFTGCSSSSSSADFPKGSVEIVVPFTAGGGMDLLARQVQPYLAEKGIETVITNIAGGSSSIGTMEVYNSEKDGYKILCSGIETIIAFHQGGVLETGIEEWSSLGTLVFDSHMIVVPKDSPYQTLADLIEDAKAHPGELNWAGTSSKGNGEMSAHEIWEAAGVDFNYVPYDGAADTRVAVMGGQADCGMIFVSEAKALLESGDLRALGVFSSERISLFPDVPTIRECGYELDNGIHRGFFCAKDVPEDIQKILSDAFQYAAEQEALETSLAEQCGFVAEYVSPEEAEILIPGLEEKYQKLYDIMMGN